MVHSAPPEVLEMAIALPALVAFVIAGVVALIRLLGRAGFHPHHEPHGRGLIDRTDRLLLRAGRKVRGFFILSK